MLRGALGMVRKAQEFKKTTTAPSRGSAVRSGGFAEGSGGFAERAGGIPIQVVSQYYPKIKKHKNYNLKFRTWQDVRALAFALKGRREIIKRKCTK